MDRSTGPFPRLEAYDRALHILRRCVVRYSGTDRQALGGYLPLQARDFFIDVNIEELYIEVHALQSYEINLTAAVRPSSHFHRLSLGMKAERSQRSSETAAGPLSTSIPKVRKRSAYSPAELGSMISLSSCQPDSPRLLAASADAFCHSLAAPAGGGASFRLMRSIQSVDRSSNISYKAAAV
jgi:hypothetical protein